ncbi:glyco -N-acetylgalactosamine 3-beta-galactosyltransferase 1-like [Brachionus plicatilis]|uniref:Glyco-N-acetylgalactosamine 3-beta-galactosyltransferase 1-like n=1 Tax=Brachionus plicatilis TaxID=10195 RepID=A0A3M7RIR3_BRAPC|nr:glyco -N-acetylgalactosamine 3-beta-galactosyltransferase 1-like [Brachionus plicatilis]
MNSLLKAFINFCFIVIVYIYYNTVLKPYESLSNYNVISLRNMNVSIFCLIKTHPENIKSNKALTVYNVWARKCDNYRFVTLLPKELLPKNINTNETFEVFDKFYMIQPKGLKTETHARLTLKVYYAMLYVYQRFPKYDWYYIVDDDAYANIENFKEFLQNKNHREPITYGYVIKFLIARGYHSGGPGYVLSNEAFVRVGSALKKNIKNCPDSGIDDVDVNKCVRKYNGKVGVSCDEKKRDRFLAMNIKDHVKGKFPSWMIKYGRCKALKGVDCCADFPIAIHYMTPEEMIRMDKAMEKHRNISKSLNSKNDSLIKGRFRDL